MLTSYSEARNHIVVQQVNRVTHPSNGGDPRVGDETVHGDAAKGRFRDGKEVKKRRDNPDRRVKTGSEENDSATDTFFDDIDPADFFDPEEFSIRRREENHREP